MQPTTTDITETITKGALNELHFGDNISVAVEDGRRSDFSLLVAMFSEDIREAISTEPLDTISTTELDLRNELQVPHQVRLRSNQESYLKSANIAKHFHEGGMLSARLQTGLNPDSLAYMTENTHDLAEDVYRNLSFHAKRTLTTTSINTLKSSLYNELVVNQRESQISTFR